MHLSDKCADLLVGSCSQSLQTSDFHLLIYAPLTVLSTSRRTRETKKEGHPTGCDSDEMPLGTEVSLLLFLLFLSLWFPHLFQDSGTARYHILKLADVQSARLKMVTRTLLWKWSTESLLLSIVPYQKFFRLIVM